MREEDDVIRQEIGPSCCVESSRAVPAFLQGMKLNEKKDRASVERLMELARESGIKTTTVDKHYLNMLCDSR
jgi:hypothetical protein